MEQQWWSEFNNSFVKGVTGFAVSLFLALNFPKVFLAVVVVSLSYGTALLAVVYAYRKRYGIVGRPERAFQFTAKPLASRKEKRSRTVVMPALEERERRKLLKLERKARLRRYKRERDRRKREQARRALAER
jgi:hypothetical protein